MSQPLTTEEIDSFILWLGGMDREDRARIAIATTASLFGMQPNVDAVECVKAHTECPSLLVIARGRCVEPLQWALEEIVKQKRQQRPPDAQFAAAPTNPAALPTEAIQLTNCSPDDILDLRMAAEVLIAKAGPDVLLMLWELAAHVNQQASAAGDSVISAMSYFTMVGIAETRARLKGTR